MTATKVTVTAPAESAAMADDEIRLIRRAQAGDREAFGELYLRHRASVLSFVRSRLNARRHHLGHYQADGEDITNETFVTAMESIGSFRLDEPGRFLNWLTGIAKHKVYDWYAQRARREMPYGDLLGVEPWHDLTVSPEDIVLNRREVVDLVGPLPARMRRVLLLRFACGLLDREVSDVMTRAEILDNTSRRMVHWLTERALRAIDKRIAEGEQRRRLRRFLVDPNEPWPWTRGHCVGRKAAAKRAA
jgi:RNA polymerase sigma-70 factor, ECF subfamily